jgi:uroporphyrin-III C-methyltransferase
MKPGKVYLVGAGPGHPDLLTLKAASLLKTCDVVVYDRLIQEEVLTLARPSAERIFMGKSVGRHESRQEEIDDVLLRKAREGKTVVRLKGGDPFVFGRGGEEAEFLAGNGIPFEVIPGVSSALAAPLSAGIAVTHRDAASCFAVVTGHEARDDQSGLDWDALSRMPTLVFLMAVHNVATIAARLIGHGRSPETPAAMIQMAFWHDEQVVTGTLATIASEVRRAGIKPPATLVVGDVVRLRERLKDSQRDLRRVPDSSSRFDPSPAPDQLIRLATAGVGTQVLGFALELSIFDHLEQARTADVLAGSLGVDADALDEMLEALVALGLLEHTRDGYRNLEIASRYLISGSCHRLDAALLHQAAVSTSWTQLADYVRHGRHAPAQLADGDDVLYRDRCEALARFAAPSVVEKLDLAERGPVLILGWGGKAYCEAVMLRWPDLRVRAANPFAVPDHLVRPLETAALHNGRYGTVLVSGLLASCRNDIERILEACIGSLAENGLLVLHDGFLPRGALPPRETVLGTLGRRVVGRGCRAWTMSRLTQTLSDLGFCSARAEAHGAGTLLVTAERSNGHHHADQMADAGS